MCCLFLWSVLLEVNHTIGVHNNELEKRGKEAGILRCVAGIGSCVHPRMPTCENLSLIKLRDGGRDGREREQAGAMNWGRVPALLIRNAATFWLGSPRRATILHLNIPSQCKDRS